MRFKRKAIFSRETLICNLNIEQIVQYKYTAVHIYVHICKMLVRDLNTKQYLYIGF